MEVKIKIGDEIIDAKIVMMNGDMVVSPKVEKFEPKDGDIVSVGDGTQIFLCKNLVCGSVIYAYFGCDLIDNEIFNEGTWSVNRLATEEEKKLLFDKIEAEGYEWDSEKKELRKKVWKPRYNDVYYNPKLDVGQFLAHKTEWHNDVRDNRYERIDWIFKTEKECQAFCDKLNQAIKDVKL